MLQRVTTQPAQAAPDYAAIKQKQQAAWSTGNYAVVGTTVQIVGEELCEAANICAGEKVIDVAAGNGNASLAAARRYADVTSTDYVPQLLDQAAKRAQADGLKIAFHAADAEALPFADGAFDVALSTFGVMFAPNQAKAASEMARVVRKGGRIGIANWMPGSFIGQLFRTIGKYLPPAPGLQSPSLWGAQEHLKGLFPGMTISCSNKTFRFRYKSPAHWLDVFRTYYGPLNRAFGALDAAGQRGLEDDILALIERLDEGKGCTVVPSEYLEAVISK